LKSCGLTNEAALDRDAWRCLIVGNRPIHASIENGRWIDDDDDDDDAAAAAADDDDDDDNDVSTFHK